MISLNKFPHKILVMFILVFIFAMPMIANPKEPEKKKKDDDGNTTKIGGIEIYTDRVYVQDTTKHLKALIFDLGYGFDGLSGAMGIRYWNLAVSMGFTGIAAPSPAFSFSPPLGVRFSPNEPLPAGYHAGNAPGSAVFIDGTYYLPYLKPFTMFATVGFYAQNDTLLAIDNESGNAFYRSYAKMSGATFGGGIEYQNSQWIRTALGYHSKRGVFFRLAYTWR